MARTRKLVIDAAIPPQQSWPYFHIIMSPECIQAVKREAMARGYKIGAFTEKLLWFALDNLEPVIRRRIR